MPAEQLIAGRGAKQNQRSLVRRDSARILEQLAKTLLALAQLLLVVDPRALGGGLPALLDQYQILRVDMVQKGRVIDQRADFDAEDTIRLPGPFATPARDILRPAADARQGLRLFEAVGQWIAAP